MPSPKNSKAIGARRWWVLALERWKNSGLSVEEFCILHKLSIDRFLYWQAQIAKAEKAVSRPRQNTNELFVPVQVSTKLGSLNCGFAGAENAYSVSEFAQALINDAETYKAQPYTAAPGLFGRGITSNKALGISIRRLGGKTPLRPIFANAFLGLFATPYLLPWNLPSAGTPRGGSTSGDSSSSVNGQVTNYGDVPPLNQGMMATQDDGKFVNGKLLIFMGLLEQKNLAHNHKN